MGARSSKSLVQRLGIREGFRVAFVNPPSRYMTTLGQLPKNVLVVQRLKGTFDFIQFFVRDEDELENGFPRLKEALSQIGMLWVCWPKGASKTADMLNENTIQDVGLRNGLVDIKVCSVDETWSALKFVHRSKDRRMTVKAS